VLRDNAATRKTVENRHQRSHRASPFPYKRCEVLLVLSIHDRYGFAKPFDAVDPI